MFLMAHSYKGTYAALVIQFVDAKLPPHYCFYLNILLFAFCLNFSHLKLYIILITIN